MRKRLVGFGVLAVLAAAAAFYFFMRGSFRAVDEPVAAAKKVVVIDYVPDDPGDYYRRHMSGWLQSHGLREGRDFQLRSRSAQGEMSNLAALVDAAKDDQADILVTFQPQALFTAIQRARGVKIVFSIVVEPFAIGAGEADDKHLPNATGFYYTPNFPKLLAAAKACKPGMARVGVIYWTGDQESETLLGKLRQAAAAAGLEIAAQAYPSQLEIPEAVNALRSQNIDALMIHPSIFQSVATPLLAKAGNDLKIPLITVLLDKVEKGIATLAYGVDQKAAAEKFGEILARVIRGEEPKDIPFFNGWNLPYRLLLNKTKAEQLGLTLPESLLREADKVL